jgi:hypothetical protein
MPVAGYTLAIVSQLERDGKARIYVPSLKPSRTGRSPWKVAEGRLRHGLQLLATQKGLGRQSARTHREGEYLVLEIVLEPGETFDYYGKFAGGGKACGVECCAKAFNTAQEAWAHERRHIGPCEVEGCLMAKGHEPDGNYEHVYQGDLR